MPAPPISSFRHADSYLHFANISILRDNGENEIGRKGTAMAARKPDWGNIKNIKVSEAITACSTDGAPSAGDKPPC